MAMLGDVITLVFSLLEGELSIRFLLKVLVVLISAGLTFTYYFVSLRLPVNDVKAKKFHRTFGIVAIAIAAISIVWGIVLAGSPATERARKFDDRRVEDIQAIKSEVLDITLGDTRYVPATERKILKPIPATLDEVAAQATYMKLNTKDPETGAAYAYTKSDDRHFSVCATFNDIRDEQYDILWNHPAGEHCYQFDVLDPNN
jgi:hypothetical protein